MPIILVMLNCLRFSNGIRLSPPVLHFETEMRQNSVLQNIFKAQRNLRQFYCEKLNGNCFCCQKEHPSLQLISICH